MPELNLSRLFDPELGATVSSGVVRPDDVERLSPLSADETPPGFSSWAEKRRREYRSGRHHAQQALTAAGGPARALLRDEDGVPLFPNGFSGSITHTGKETTFAAAAIVKTPHHVGIDAEVLRDLPEDMVAHVLTDQERGMLGEVPESQTPFFAAEGERALLAFSAKEAFYKCVFPTLRCRLEFHDVEFRLVSGAPDGSTPGRFEVAPRRSDVELQNALKGLYVYDSRHVICAVCWDGDNA